MPLNAPPFAVIDIGSNSVRMVVYHALSRVPMPLFNEKYYCALARDLEQTGYLNPDGIAKAERALARFKLMLERFGINGALVIATAAIREATDGADFAERLRRHFGLDVQVIDGQREAELAAYGIIASMWQPSGLCADLGGGSLELAYIENGEIRKLQTLPLGALRLMADRNGTCENIRQYVRGALQQVGWLRDHAFAQCYAIGGSFRSIGKMHARCRDYPLPLVHEYQLQPKPISELSRELNERSPESIAAMPGVSARRAVALPVAAIILDELVTLTGSEQVIFSVAGIREGVLFEQLDPTEQQKDPLQASAEVLQTIAGRKGRYALELFEWMQPLFADESPFHQRLRRALCHLSEIAWTIDPNFRAEWSFVRIIQADMKGLSHRERLMLALALFHRYQIKCKKDWPALALLGETDRCWAACVGIAANLGFHLSGGQAGNLHHAQLIRRDHSVSLKLNDNAAPLRTEPVEKRLAGLSCAYAAFHRSNDS